MIVHDDVKQNSREWINLRLGIPTASEFSRIVTPGGKLSKSATSERYMFQLLAEWAIGMPLEEERSTDFMARGHELEPKAAESYMFETGHKLKTVGFITTDDGMIGASPDRLVVGVNRALEIKCPAIQTHVRYMMTGAIQEEYKPQVQGQMLVAELDGLDIQSYCPPFPAVIIRVERDEQYIALLREALGTFVGQMLEARKTIEQKYGPFKYAGGYKVPDEDTQKIAGHPGIVA
jgi:putative phage-type endonuclease